MNDDHELQRLVEAARNGDQGKREDAINRCRLLAARTASAVAGRPLVWENDDELSVALMAVNEAIDLYDPARGATFIGFARLVIRRRLVDHFRREGRHRHAALDEEAAESDPAVVRQSHLAAVRQEEARGRAEELQELGREMAPFGVTLADLHAAAPSRDDARRNLVEAAEVLVRDPALRRRFFEARQVPMADLSRQVRVSRKTLERGRTYLVALAIILDRDLLFMKEYLKPLLRGEGPAAMGRQEGGAGHAWGD